MKTKLFTLIFAILISAASYGQEMFKVLASKGTNKVISGGVEQKLLIGKKLVAADKLVIGEGGYIGLAHSSGKTIELKKAGTYEVSKLGTEVTAQNAGVAKKYVDYMAGQMTSGDEDMAKNRHKYMAVTGSVKRGSESIKPVSPEKAYCLADNVYLKWSPLDKPTTYVITITDMADEVLYTTETNETFLVVDLGKINLKQQEGKTVLWKVQAKGNANTESEKRAISYIDQHPDIKNPEVIEKEASEMRAELKEETALNKFVLATYFDEKGLVLEALENYEAAIKIEPDVEDYKAAYGQFLINSELVKKEGDK